MAFLDFLPVIGDAISGIAGMAAQHSANETNKELAKYAFEQNEKMWHMQNEYNDPSAQMERLRKAGLNPNLVYGNGVTGNAAGSAPNYQAPHVEATTNGRFFADAARDATSGVLALQQQRENIELAKSQRQVQLQQSLESAARTAETYAKTARSQFDLDLAKELRNYSVEGAKANVAKVWSDIERNDMQNQVSQAELTLIPLRAKVSEAQYNSLVTTTAQAVWELQQEKEGRFIGKDAWSVIANQVLRKMRGEPNMFDNPRSMKQELKGELKAKEHFTGSDHRAAIDTSGNTTFKVPKGGV